VRAIRKDGGGMVPVVVADVAPECRMSSFLASDVATALSTGQVRQHVVSRRHPMANRNARCQVQVGLDLAANMHSLLLLHSDFVVLTLPSQL
jgi:hypothetical protein